MANAKHIELPNGIILDLADEAVIKHKYSTEEKVVGEWINGKPVYERTINIMLNGALCEGINKNNNEYTIECIENIIDTWIDAKCFSKRSSDAIAWIDINSSDTKTLVLKSNGHIWLSGNVYSAYIILQYTKTTD